jgi:hypothetical protein
MASVDDTRLFDGEAALSVPGISTHARVRSFSRHGTMDCRERAFSLPVNLFGKQWKQGDEVSKIIGAAVWITISTAAMAQTSGYPASPGNMVCQMHGVL